MKFVLRSNRQTPDYGDSRFGVDYNQVIGNHIRAHYRPVAHIDPRQLGQEVTEPAGYFDNGEWHATA